MSTTLIAAVSDVHAGGTTAVCTPEPIVLDDGGSYVPNKPQKWLWKQWQKAWSKRYPELVEDYKPDKQILVLNGDLVEGWHHDSAQQVSILEGLHFRIAHRLLERGPMQNDFDEMHFIRGTESHVGKHAGHEEGLARALKKQHGYPVVRDPDTGQYTSWWRRLMVDDVLVDMRHHGRQGQRTHTKDSYLRLYAHDIWESHVRSGDRPPDLCIRAHHHRYGDSGRIHDMPTRVVSLPCWQLLTAWTHRISIEDLGQIGMCVFAIRDGRLLEPHPILFKAARPKIVKA